MWWMSARKSCGSNWYKVKRWAMWPVLAGARGKDAWALWTSASFYPEQVTDLTSALPGFGFTLVSFISSLQIAHLLTRTLSWATAYYKNAIFKLCPWGLTGEWLHQVSEESLDLNFWTVLKPSRIRSSLIWLSVSCIMGWLWASGDQRWRRVLICGEGHHFPEAHVMNHTKVTGCWEI